MFRRLWALALRGRLERGPLLVSVSGNGGATEGGSVPGLGPAGASRSGYKRWSDGRDVQGNAFACSKNSSSLRFMARVASGSLRLMSFASVGSEAMSYSSSFPSLESMV